MKSRVMKGMAVAVAIVASWCVGPAFGGRAPPNLVSGVVSGVSGNSLVVDGKSYSVKLQGDALRQLQHVQVGQAVDLVLSGSPKSASSQVVGIHVHEASH